MGLLDLIVIMMSTISVVTQAFPWFRDIPDTAVIEDNINVQILQQDSHPRFARSVQDAEMPDTMHFRFRLVGHDVNIRVKRSGAFGKKKGGKRDMPDFPVFVIQDGRIQRKQIIRHHGLAFYANETTGSSFVVRRTKSRSQFIMEGIFYQGLKKLHLSPGPASPLHRVHKQNVVVDFREDYVGSPGGYAKPSSKEKTPDKFPSMESSSANDRLTGLEKDASQSKLPFTDRHTAFHSSDNKSEPNFSANQTEPIDSVKQTERHYSANQTEPPVPDSQSEATQTEPHAPGSQSEATQTKPHAPGSQSVATQTEPHASDSQPEATQTEPHVPDSQSEAPHSKTKRQAGDDHEVQLFMVADYRDYRTWLQYYGYNSTQTELEMNLYYAFIANSMSVRYSSVMLVDPSFRLDIIISGLLIVNSQSVSYWTEDYTLRPGSHYVDASSALDSFRHWVKSARFDLPHSDHWMLFTGFDIYTDRNPNVAGLAKLGGMCSLSSVSIIEQDNTGSVGATAAHELGHSLGALHDGEEKTCYDEDNYVMSRKLKTPDDELLASRPWQFSPCSVRAFKRFVSQTKCTHSSSIGMSVLSTKLSPGQVFSADLQCQLALGNGSYFGRSLQIREGYPSMCRRLYCAVPGEPGLYQAIFAMEKTSCGDGKWCQQGKCVDHTEAPHMEDTCPQGDDPTAPCVKEDCPYYTVRTKTVYCCTTCHNMMNSWLGYLVSRVSQGHVVRQIEASPAVASPDPQAATTTAKTTPTSTSAISSISTPSKSSFKTTSIGTAITTLAYTPTLLETVDEYSVTPTTPNISSQSPQASSSTTNSDTILSSTFQNGIATTTNSAIVDVDALPTVIQSKVTLSPTFNNEVTHANFVDDTVSVNQTQSTATALEASPLPPVPTSLRPMSSLDTNSESNVSLVSNFMTSTVDSLVTTQHHDSLTMQRDFNTIQGTVSATQTFQSYPLLTETSDATSIPMTSPTFTSQPDAIPSSSNPIFDNRNKLPELLTIPRSEMPQTSTQTFAVQQETTTSSFLQKLLSSELPLTPSSDVISRLKESHGVSGVANSSSSTSLPVSLLSVTAATRLSEPSMPTKKTPIFPPSVSSSFFSRTAPSSSLQVNDQSTHLLSTTPMTISTSSSTASESQISKTQVSLNEIPLSTASTSTFMFPAETNYNQMPQGEPGNSKGKSLKFTTDISTGNTEQWKQNITNESYTSQYTSVTHSSIGNDNNVTRKHLGSIDNELINNTHSATKKNMISNVTESVSKDSHKIPLNIFDSRFSQSGLQSTTENENKTYTAKNTSDASHSRLPETTIVTTNKQSVTLHTNIANGEIGTSTFKADKHPLPSPSSSHAIEDGKKNFTRMTLDEGNKNSNPVTSNSQKVTRIATAATSFLPETYTSTPNEPTGTLTKSTIVPTVMTTVASKASTLRVRPTTYSTASSSPETPISTTIANVEHTLRIAPTPSEYSEVVQETIDQKITSTPDSTTSPLTAKTSPEPLLQDLNNHIIGRLTSLISNSIHKKTPHENQLPLGDSNDNVYNADMVQGRQLPGNSLHNTYSDPITLNDLYQLGIILDFGIDREGRPLFTGSSHNSFRNSDRLIQDGQTNGLHSIFGYLPVQPRSVPSSGADSYHGEHNLQVQRKTKAERLAFLETDALVGVTDNPADFQTFSQVMQNDPSPLEGEPSTIINISHRNDGLLNQNIEDDPTSFTVNHRITPGRDEIELTQARHPKKAAVLPDLTQLSLGPHQLFTLGVPDRHRYGVLFDTNRLRERNGLSWINPSLTAAASLPQLARQLYTMNEGVNSPHRIDPRFTRERGWSKLDARLNQRQRYGPTNNRPIRLNARNRMANQDKGGDAMDYIKRFDDIFPADTRGDSSSDLGAINIHNPPASNSQSLGINIQNLSNGNMQDFSNSSHSQPETSVNNLRLGTTAVEEAANNNNTSNGNNTNQNYDPLFENLDTTKTGFDVQKQTIDSQTSLRRREDSQLQFPKMQTKQQTGNAPLVQNELHTSSHHSSPLASIDYHSSSPRPSLPSGSAAKCRFGCVFYQEPAPSTPQEGVWSRLRRLLMPSGIPQEVDMRRRTMNEFVRRRIGGR